VTDGLASNSYTSKDFKPNTGSTQDYGYDDNGNMSANADKRISAIDYNYLNLPENVSMSGSTGSMTYAYDAVGSKLQQQVFAGSTLESTTDYIGKAVFKNGTLDYLMHEEGRVAFEYGSPVYEFFIKDHLGNVRQVLRDPNAQGLMATMEIENQATEEASFSQIATTRQTGIEHNVTIARSQQVRELAWLNAERGRILGPGRTQEIHAGDSLTLQVHGKYADENVQQVNVGSYVTQAAKGRLVESLSELAGSLKHSGTGNPIALLNLADILASDLQHKKAPEAYMLYALYDADSNRYEVED